MLFDSDVKPVAFLYVSDRDRALSFYCGTLGLVHRSADPFGDFLEMGPALVRMTTMPDYKAGPHPALGWDVADIAAAARALKGKGVTLTIYEGMGQDEDGVWTAPDGKTKVAWFADPDGNVLSISET
jgi:catechol 2,3-dioxygenase-like lactoylglutathione lyase family enzyme